MKKTSSSSDNYTNSDSDDGTDDAGRLVSVISIKPLWAHFNVQKIIILILGDHYQYMLSWIKPGWCCDVYDKHYLGIVIKLFCGRAGCSAKLELPSSMSPVNQQDNASVWTWQYSPSSSSSSSHTHTHDIKYNVLVCNSC